MLWLQQMSSPAYDYNTNPDTYILERDRLEQLYKDGKLEIVARRDVTVVKSYADYLLESKASNARIRAKYGAKPGAMPPMHLPFEA